MTKRTRAYALSAALTLALAAPGLPALSAGTAAAAPASGAAAVSPAATGAELPRPTGPYGVGRDTLRLVDQDRTDPWVPESGPRRLLVSMYYPAAPGTGRPAPYLTADEARAFLVNNGVTGSLAEPMSATRVHSRLDARALPGRYPLVVLSPGFSLSRLTLSLLAEDLTSRGYVVALVDHAYESFGTSWPDGSFTSCVACEVHGEEGKPAVADVRSADVSFLLDRLTGARPAWERARLIDRSRIGMAGHSIGGDSAEQTMSDDPRVLAGVNMDGSFHRKEPGAGVAGRPFLLLGTDSLHRPGGGDTSWDTTWERLDGWKRWLTVAGSAHVTSFTDVSAVIDQLGMEDPTGATLPPDRANAIVREYLAAFFDRHLRHVPRPLLDGESAAYPEVAFHRP
ncbi:alpha/beta hydrolase family protein [Streptomyces sp. NPDC059255]|uniref:alpha/beta hydrolase family protein n=1 Tax=Streptomyces sp. NPDC059255 TaxID=3346793 RepID=UPI0036967F17